MFAKFDQTLDTMVTPYIGDTDDRADKVIDGEQVFIQHPLPAHLLFSNSFMTLHENSSNISLFDAATCFRLRLSFLTLSPAL
jgi:hypothetical protein